MKFAASFLAAVVCAAYLLAKPDASLVAMAFAVIVCVMCFAVIIGDVRR